MTAAAFRRAAALTALIGQACLLANLVTWLAAADYDIGRALDPSSFVSLAPRIGLLRASLALDLAAYVLIVPLVAYLWTEFEPLHAARARMYAAGGLAYSLVGATGAAVLFTAWPPLMRAYEAGPDPALAAVFEAFTEVAYRGMWNIVGAAGIGVWLLGTGTLLRPTRRGMGLVAVVAGLAALADAVLVLVGAEAASYLALAVLGVLAPLWITGVSVELLRGRSLVTNAGRAPAMDSVGRPEPDRRTPTS